MTDWSVADGSYEQDRPDPLAEPAGYGAPRVPAGPQRSETCITDGCKMPATAVVWLGCTKGEHAGPADYCQGCARHVIGQAALGFVVCGPCGVLDVRMRLLKVEHLEAGEDEKRLQEALDRL